MSKKRGLEPAHDEHVNVTPLIDIVMCLIIFFMICGKLVEGEVAGGISIPKAKEAAAIEQQSRLIVNVVPILQNPPFRNIDTPPEKQIIGASFVVNQKEIATSGSIMMPGHEADLITFLRNEKAQNPDLRLLIRCDRNLPYPMLSPLIVSCAKADIQSMHFATEQE